MITAARTTVAAPARRVARTESQAWLRRLQGYAPVVFIGLAIVAFWYVAGVYKNMDLARLVLGSQASTESLVRQSLNLPMPWIPLPHQVLGDFLSALAQPLDSPRGLWIHMGTTGLESLLGLLLGTALGLVIATVFVHSRILESAFLPYVVASQTVPVIALAPIVIGIMGISLAAKVVIAAYLVFFSVTVSLVKGFKSTEPLAYDLMRSYAASTWQVYWKLRLPAALPFLFTGLKVGATASLVGAIIAELPFGSSSGLGARLLVATTYGETIAWWSTMLAAAVLGMVGFAAISGLERLVVKRQIGPGGML
jgi:NitT/TauT family transport system permease protein